MSASAPIVSRVESTSVLPCPWTTSSRRRSTTSRAHGSATCARTGAVRDGAVARLHALLLRAARFETGRRRASHPHLRGDLDDTAQEAADDALLAVLARLEDYRGLSRFTTWAYKFALYQASVKVRRRAWQGREVPVEDAAWGVLASAGLPPEDEAEQRRAARRDPGRHQARR